MSARPDGVRRPSRSHPGDNGIQFDPQDKDAARLAAVLFGPEAEEDFRGERRIHGDGWPRMN